MTMLKTACYCLTILLTSLSVVEAQPRQNHPSPCSTLRVGLMPDLTLSGPEQGLRFITTEHVRSILEAPSDCEVFEFGIVAVTDSSQLQNVLKIKLTRIEAPNLQDLGPIEYRKRLKEVKRLKELRNQKINDFLNDASKRLKLSEDAPRSDISGALKKLERYFDEPSIYPNTQKLLLISSDLKHTAKHGRDGYEPPDIETWIALGSASPGPFEEALIFEDITSMISFFANRYSN